MAGRNGLGFQFAAFACNARIHRQDPVAAAIKPFKKKLYSCRFDDRGRRISGEHIVVEIEVGGEGLQILDEAGALFTKRLLSRFWGSHGDEHRSSPAVASDRDELTSGSLIYNIRETSFGVLQADC